MKLGDFPSTSELSLGGPIGVCGVHLYHSANQTVGTTGTVLTWDSEEFDTDGFHDPGSNPTRITIPAGLGGVYLGFAGVEWPNGIGGTVRQHYAQLNVGAATPRGWILNASNNSGNPSYQRYPAGWPPIRFADGDYVVLRAYHDASGNVTVNKGNTYFAILRVGG